MANSISALAGIAFLAAVSGLQPARADIPAVQHVVIIFQENRTPDNLFHGLASYLPSADIASSGRDSKGETIKLTSVPLANKYDMDHSNKAFVEMYDGGKIDGADLVSCQPNAGTKCPPNAAFRFVQPADVAPYFYLAINYGFANRMFQSNQGPSFPAHQFIIAGTSQPSATSLFFAANDPFPISPGGAGCNAAAATKVLMIGPDNMMSRGAPCFEHGTLTDLIDNPPAGARAGITWRYYTPTQGSIWTAPNAIRHMCQPSSSANACVGPDWTNGKIVTNSAQVLTDIAQNNLASVSWVIPTSLESDHAGGNDGTGPAWVASVVNAIGNSAYWSNTVILITWDDWGGWYDHVTPPIDNQYGYYENGFRVPLLVVSPYTPAGYVSQVPHTFGSILKFIETAYGLPVIPPGTFQDARSDDLSDFFNFSMRPRPFQAVPAAPGAGFFLHDKRPVEGPDAD